MMYILYLFQFSFDIKMDTWSTFALGGLILILAFWFKIRKKNLVDNEKTIKVSAFKIDDFIMRFYPGRKVINVEPDGGCMTRSVAFCLFKDDKHWTLLSKAINEFIRENLPLIRE